MRSGLYKVSDLARRSGVAPRTIRFWADEGLIPIARRSRGGYRLFDEGAVARLDLVRTLRELGLGLEATAAILRRQRSIAEVARAHVEALEARIRTLSLQRALLRFVARSGATIEEAGIMHRLATLSAKERQEIVDDFVAKAFEGVLPSEPGARIAESMRRLPAALPDDPSDAQVAAWLELAELVRDASFAARVREMAVAGATPTTERARYTPDPARVQAEAGAAVRDGIDPTSPRGRAILDRIVPAELGAEERRALRDQLATFADARVERYWELLGILNGWPPRPPMVPAFSWLIEALATSCRKRC